MGNASGGHPSRALEVIRTAAVTCVADLRRRGYATTTVHAYSAGIAHFQRWLAMRCHRGTRVDEALVHRFLTVHLPACSCPRRWQRTGHVVRAALRQLLRVLRNGELVPRAEARISQEIRAEIERFDSHLESTCGLAPSTRRARRRDVTAFLRGRFKGQAIRVEAITTRDVVSFVSSLADPPAPSRFRLRAAALRSYLRFRAVANGDAIARLVAAIPPAPCWRLATLPSHLTDDEVARVLDAFDRARPCGRRGYAMTRCLLDLGLRASEVAALRLENIDCRPGR